ncbi:hypothetical protein N7481_004479 [Penicillium waksmanii]|uniref:uncharacterized protein n=1 Tax=Penicillium waksmanii TaxID=69791 RepID=UPI002548AE45|nr:uncharacterized protein N7481_004479 [Penicillium waksmanii]KAJ5989269.1 hypothetical protein N7481_004479 [Penicillium waksmanii]
MGQPKVPPLPSNLDLAGKTAVVTGASAGMGLETARQLLARNCDTLILAVRNTTKGEACAQELLNNPTIKAKAKCPVVKALPLDVDRYDSVKSFAKCLQKEVPVVNILILNAGIARLNMDRVPTENYLSNALLLFELLPYLYSSAEKSGFATRVTWVGSRKHDGGGTFESTPPAPGSLILNRLDSDERSSVTTRYADSKLLCAMFMYALAPRLDSTKIVLNMICPGMVSTGMSDFLPWYGRVLAGALKIVKGARPVEVGGLLIVNAAVVAGVESHGRHLSDKKILE